MDKVIASHLTNIEDFRNYASITNLKITEEFFNRQNNYRLFFFDEEVGENGPCFRSCFYQGQFEGYYICYQNFNTVKEYEGWHSRNKKHGHWIKYFSNGQKRSEGSYVYNEKDGIWIHYRYQRD